MRKASTIPASIVQAQEPHDPHEALAAVKEIQDATTRAEALMDLIPRLPKRALPEALGIIGSVPLESGRVRSLALATIGPYLPHFIRQGVFAEAIDIAVNLPDERKDIIARIAYHIPHAERHNVFNDAIRNAQASGDRLNSILTMAAIAPHLRRTNRDAIFADLFNAVSNFDADHKSLALDALIDALNTQTSYTQDDNKEKENKELFSYIGILPYYQLYSTPLPNIGRADTLLPLLIDLMEKRYGKSTLEDALKNEMARIASSSDATAYSVAFQTSLHEIFRSSNIDKSQWESLTASIQTNIATIVQSAARPKWDNRGKYAELKDLSSPAFLKQVYSDHIGADGTIAKKTVRDIDATLMKRVEKYISDREEKGLPLGDAAGLRFVKNRSGRPKRGTLG